MHTDFRKLCVCVFVCVNELSMVTMWKSEDSFLLVCSPFPLCFKAGCFLLLLWYGVFCFPRESLVVSSISASHFVIEVLGYQTYITVWFFTGVPGNRFRLSSFCGKCLYICRCLFCLLMINLFITPTV